MDNTKLFKVFLVHGLILLIGLCTLGFANAQAVVSETKVSKVERAINVDLGFTGLNVDNLQNQTTTFGFLTRAQMQQAFTPELKAKIAANLVLETGSNKSINLEEFKPNQGIFLDEAYLQYAPLSFLKLQLGAINQSYLESPLLITSTAFVGVKERLFYNKDEQEYYIEAEQAIPTNQTLAKRLGSVDEGTPSFQMASAGVDLQGNFLSLKAAVSYFQFKNLSNSVANESRLMGNSIKGNSQNTAQYIYGFSGLNTTYELSMRLRSGFTLFNSTQYLFNQEAPDGRNTGYLTNFGVAGESFKVSTELFYNESDSSPAYYNDKSYGHNNRKGFALGLELTSQQYDLTFNAKYIKANLIEQNQYQSDSNIILFNIMRSYDF